MYQEDYFNPADSNDYDENDVTEDAITKALRQDKGLNTLTRKVRLDSGKIKNKRIRVFTSGGTGTRIRDAETGEYYPNKVGSKDEDLFFKVSIATGECNSANGSNILFYCSPQHYENHLYADVEQEHIAAWDLKRDARLKELKREIKPQFETIIVR
jgi:hypothetical protein